MKNLLFGGFLVLFGLAATAAAADPRPDATARRPNVLFIAVDDLNHWVGYLGRNPQTITPNIDRLAARGVRFTQGYCAAPVCNPSRAALMSGLRPCDFRRLRQRDDWRTVIARRPDADGHLPQGRLLRGRAGQDLSRGVHRPQRMGRLLRMHARASDPKPTGDTASAASSSRRSIARTRTCREYQIVNYGIEQLDSETRQAVLPGRRPAQAAHALERSAQVLRHAPARTRSNCRPSWRRPERRSCRPGSMAKPEGDHAADAGVGPLERGGAGLPGRDRVCRRQDRPLDRRARHKRRTATTR